MSIDALAEALAGDTTKDAGGGMDTGDETYGSDAAPGDSEGADATGEADGDGEIAPETQAETTVETPLKGACEDGETVQAGTLDTHPVFDAWGERTVDQQTLADLLNNWVLVVKGLVENPVELRICDLIKIGLEKHIVDFHCVEGWSIYDVPWNGIPLSVILDLVKPTNLATHMKIVCQTGKYTESLSLEVAREPKSILALGINDHTLPLKHGFPARIVVPRLLGYKSPKFVQTIELVHYQHVGYWPKFGYTVEGLVPENRLRPGKY